MNGCMVCSYRALAAGSVVGYAAHFFFKMKPAYAAVIGLVVAFLLSPYKKGEVSRGVGDNY